MILSTTKHPHYGRLAPAPLPCEVDNVARHPRALAIARRVRQESACCRECARRVTSTQAPRVPRQYLG